jgi:ketosteroid isomerase-like protein
MSTEDTEVVRELIAAYNRRDREAFAALLHPDVEWRTLGGPLFGVDAIQGREAMVRWAFEQIPEGIAEYRVSLEELRELSGGQLLLVATYGGRGVVSGVAVGQRIASIYRLEGGKVIFSEDFETTEQALEAAGKRE